MEALIRAMIKYYFHKSTETAVNLAGSHAIHIDRNCDTGHESEKHHQQ